MIDPFKGKREERERTSKSRQGFENKRKGKAGEKVAERTYVIHGKHVNNETNNTKKGFDLDVT